MVAHTEPELSPHTHTKSIPTHRATPPEEELSAD